MLLFIISMFPVFLRFVRFQYISCYSLSYGGMPEQISKNGFQYISCYSLSFLPIVTRKDHVRFNTSHVTLYHNRNGFSDKPDYVSIHLMLLFIKEDLTDKQCSKRFNTSHVTLYQRKKIYIDTESLFQYISCYSLSRMLTRLSIPMCVSIHLMLLFIMRTGILMCYPACFNTSHVTLYR